MKMTQEELDKRRAAGGRTVRKKRATAKAEPAPAAGPTDMAAMAASMEAIGARQEAVNARLADELEKFNARTKARVTVTKRNSDGGIEAADIEIVGA